MRKFNDRFHPADAIGYAYGIHHDTDHLHVHVALCPRTQRGAYIGCSTTRSPHQWTQGPDGIFAVVLRARKPPVGKLALSSPKQLEQVPFPKDRL